MQATGIGTFFKSSRVVVQLVFLETPTSGARQLSYPGWARWSQSISLRALVKHPGSPGASTTRSKPLQALCS
jgi:hypothetical protein